MPRVPERHLSFAASALAGALIVAIAWNSAAYVRGHHVPLLGYLFVGWLDPAWRLAFAVKFLGLPCRHCAFRVVISNEFAGRIGRCPRNVTVSDRDAVVCWDRRLRPSIRDVRDGIVRVASVWDQVRPVQAKPCRQPHAAEYKATFFSI